MEHALPYLDTEDAFDDDFVRENNKATFHNETVIAIGDAAKQLKRQKLAEVIRAAAIAFAEKKGDQETVIKLKTINVTGREI